MWALTETFGASKATDKNTYIIGTSVNIHKDSNPGGAGSYEVFNSKTDKGLKLRIIQSTTPLTLVVNPGYKVTNVIINAYQNNKTTGTITCDSYAVDGASPVAFGSPINIPLNVENASTQTLGTISVDGIEATSSIAFNFTNTGAKQNQIYAFIEVTYEEVKDVIYSKSVTDWASSDVTKTALTTDKWYNSDGVVGSNYLIDMYVTTTEGLRLISRNGGVKTAELKLNRTKNKIVTIDAVWNAGASDTDSNTPYNVFTYGDFSLKQTVRSDNYKTQYTINGVTTTIDSNSKVTYREEGGRVNNGNELTIHLKVNSYNGNIIEFYVLAPDASELVNFSNLTSTTNHFASGANYDIVRTTTYESGSSKYAWNALKSITVSEQEQAIYSYTVNAVDEASNVLYKKAEGTVLSSDNSVKVTYDAFYLKGNSLLQADRLSADSKEYNYTFNVTEDNQVFNIVYKDKSYNNVIYYKEAENIETLNPVGSGNVPVRCSGGKGGYAASDAIITSLPAGKYKVSSFAYGSSGTDLDIYAGTTKIKTFSTASTTLSVNTSDEFTLEETTNIIFKAGGNGGSSPKVLDFIFIQNTSDKEIVGAVDKSTGANGANSSDYTMKPGDTKVFTFQNHGQDNGKNWRIAVKQGETWKANVCADSYDYTANAATKVSYKVSKDGGSSQVDQDWTEFQADMADARVVATLAYGTDGTLAITTTSTGVANGYIYYVDQDVTGLSGDVTVNLSVNESWLEVLSVGQTAVGVTVSPAGYATYVNSDYDLNFSATSIKAYKVKVSSKGVATMTKVDNVPAGTPVLLYKDGGATESIPVMTGAAAVTENDLVAGNSTTATEGVATTDGEYTNMILNNISGNVGFYLAAGQTVAANRAYLHFNSSLAPNASAPMMMVFDGETTGISEMKTMRNAENEIFFDLQGRKVAQPAKGLYIVNGKKVVIK